MQEHDQVVIKLTGYKRTDVLPSGFMGATRATAGDSQAAVDRGQVFIPDGFLVPVKTYDTTPAARGSASVEEIEAAADELLVLELADGATLVTTAGNLLAGLRQTRPDLVSGNQVMLDNLNTDLATQRGGLAGAVKGFITTVSWVRVVKDAKDLILDKAIELAGASAIESGSRLGVRCLMRAIEDQLETGLFRWRRPGEAAPAFEPVKEVTIAPEDVADQPILLFIHGTASNTAGSFGHLRNDDHALWSALEAKFGEHLYAFDHRTLSESPIENAIALVRKLPPGARVSLVTHSRGGLVGDLLCLGDFASLIADYEYAFDQVCTSGRHATGNVRADIVDAYKEQREGLAVLAELLRERKLVIQRYLRTASPANGTLLASGNFDVFLSSILTLIGAVPLFFGNPVYWAFKRAVIEIVRRRTDPHLVPGIEAMLPDSAMAQLLRDAPVKPGIEMAVVAGDVEGGNMLSRLGVALSDFLLFGKEDNDLVVNTPAMLAGIAPKAGARVLFDRGSHVSHFRYFTNAGSRKALRDWLTTRSCDLHKLGSFAVLPGRGEVEAAEAKTAARSAAADSRLPIVVVLPDTMGSHLAIDGKRVWFDPAGAAFQGLSTIAWDRPDRAKVEATDLFDVSYARLGEHLSASHRVVGFPYDWRQPLEVLGDRLGTLLERLMRETQEPIRLLAHGMGGLVLRACIRRRRTVMNDVMQRAGARLIMLGTPNNGTHATVEHLLGKGESLRTLWRLGERRRDGGRPALRELLGTYGAFPGVMQLLPRPGFSDTFHEEAESLPSKDFQKQETWSELAGMSDDPWFGERCCAVPGADALASAAWLWKDDDGKLLTQAQSLPQEYEKKSIYVFGVAPNTPCGVRTLGGSGQRRLKMVGTASGDGVVTWESGRLAGIGSYYYMPVQHGDLPATAEYFPALAELLTSGATSLLGSQPPAPRQAAVPRPVLYGAGPPVTSDIEAVQRCLMGGSLRNRSPAGTRLHLKVDVIAMDLRFVSNPIMVGHYEQDPIAGPEALIDRELLGGDLGKRYSLGLYAGPRGSSTVVLRAPPGSENRRARVSGAVVTGLGPYDGSLSASDLTETVRVGALRYLLQIVDVLGKEDRELPLASLLIGFSSSANLSVASSVDALVRGVIQANARFHETTGLNIRIASLDIVELYLDTAISAVYALRQLRERLVEHALAHDTTLSICNELVTGEGMRQRLFDDTDASYWPRLIITDADLSEATPAVPVAPPHPAAGGSPPAMATRLRYMYVSTRARAMTVVQQRQPGLIEGLVRQQIASTRWNEDFGRMLFQLMVPHDFKDAARQLDRVVLVVDEYTANLPWELMLADGPARGDGIDRDRLPLAMRAAVVRQLSSSRYRLQVTQASARNALVIGDPSVRGYADAFPVPDGERSGSRWTPPPLEGARREAQAISDALAKHDYRVTSIFRGAAVARAAAARDVAAPAATRDAAPGPVDGRPGPDDECSANEVLSALYRHPWRILHIAAHGVYDLPHADKRPRSGILLSDGLLITAAEIAAMEVVPALVFLNCCHSGQIDAGRDSNKLAASVARELINIGVRCVIVAGWAINDEHAKKFGETFYKELLGNRKQFGEAVFAARKEIWSANDITWGAFQAYGDPGWMAEALPENTDDTAASELYVSVEELLDDLANMRVQLAHQHETLATSDNALLAHRVKLLMEKRCPPNWRNLPQLHSALGATWRELDRLEPAYREFLAATQREDQLGRVPINDIEQLADVESALAERCGGSAIEDGNYDLVRQAEDLIDQARKRLDSLDSLAAMQPLAIAGCRAGDAAVGTGCFDIEPLLRLNKEKDSGKDGNWPGTQPRANSVRKALLGTVWKRKASLKARQLKSTMALDRATVRGELHRCLDAAVKAYMEAEGSLDDGQFAPDLALDRLALQALRPPADAAARDAAVALARFCERSAQGEGPERFRAAPALRRPKALLVQMLMQGSLGDQGDIGQLMLEKIVQSYAYAIRNITLKPSEIRAMVGDIETLSRLVHAVVPDPADRQPQPNLVSNRLMQLAMRLQPGTAATQQMG